MDAPVFLAWQSWGNWEEHRDHFILADCSGETDFGEGKKSIYALEGAQVLVQRDKEVQLAVNEFGRGRMIIDCLLNLPLLYRPRG